MRDPPPRRRGPHGQQRRPRTRGPRRRHPARLPIPSTDRKSERELLVRFTYAEAMTDATYYAPLAQAAEAAGYTSMTVADSLIYPKESDSQYPYTDTGD